MRRPTRAWSWPLGFRPYLIPLRRFAHSPRTASRTLARPLACFRIGFGVDALKVWREVTKFIGIAKDGKHQSAFQRLDADEVCPPSHDELANCHITGLG